MTAPIFFTLSHKKYRIDYANNKCYNKADLFILFRRYYEKKYFKKFVIAGNFVICS